MTQTNLPEIVIMPDGMFKTVSKMNNLVGYFPNKSCKKCHGRGWYGKYVLMNDPKERKIHLLCKCLRKDEGSLTCGIEW